MEFNVQINCKIEASDWKDAQEKTKIFMKYFEKMIEEYSLILENNEGDDLNV